MNDRGGRHLAAAAGTWSNRLSELADHLARVSDIAELSFPAGSPRGCSTPTTSA